MELIGVKLENGNYLYGSFPKCTFETIAHTKEAAINAWYMNAETPAASAELSHLYYLLWR